jgi:hypothetical protein
VKQHGDVPGGGPAVVDYVELTVGVPTEDVDD